MYLRTSHGRSGAKQARLSAALLALLLAAATTVVLGAADSNAAPVASYSIWTDVTKPVSLPDSDARPVVLGVKFATAQPGKVTAIRYYKIDASTEGSAEGTLWDSTGQVLAKAKFSSRDGIGWKTATLSSPIAIRPGSSYVASYTAPKGRYAGDQQRLGGGTTVTTRDLTAQAGVYSYELAFPSRTWNNSNYYADIMFQPGSEAESTAPSASTRSTTATSRTASAPTTTAMASSSSTRSTPPSTAITSATPSRSTTVSTSRSTGLTTSSLPRTTTPSSTATTGTTTGSGGSWLLSFPNSTNTGYKAAPGYSGTLANCSNEIRSNTTYRFCNFPDGVRAGRPGTPVSNVTFYGCRFASNSLDDANVATAGDNITFDYSSFEPSADNAPPTTYSQGYQYGIDVRSAGRLTIDHSDFWGWGNAIQFGSSSQAQPLTVRNSFFHDARSDGGIDHTDGILSNEGGPSYMVFDHNTIVSEGNTQGLALQTENRAYDHVTITNNYFSGFGYTVAIGENMPSTNITFTGNVFGTDIKPDWGPLYSNTQWTASLGNTWRNNKWRVVPGSYYTPTSDDGKFWLPSGIKSTTDYGG